MNPLKIAAIVIGGVLLLLGGRKPQSTFSTTARIDDCLGRNECPLEQTASDV